MQTRRWFSCVVVGCVWLGALSAWGAPDPALLGAWSFDDGEGDIAIDTSSAGRDAELFDAQWVKGAFGTAIRLGGKGEHVVIPEISDLDGGNALSLQAWVCWEGSGRYPNVLTGGQWSPGGFLLFVNDRTCHFRMGRPGHKANTPGQRWREVSAPLVNQIEFGRWYHLTATFQRPQITTYLDGKRVGAARWDHPVAHKGDIRLGVWAGTTTHTGLLDELRIFSRALSADEIAATYDVQKKGRTGGAGAPVSYEIIHDDAMRSPPAIVVRAGDLTLGFSTRGRVVELSSAAAGIDLLSRSLPFAQVRVGNRTYRRATCEQAGPAELLYRFHPNGPELRIGVRSAQDYFVLELLSLKGEGVAQVEFLRLCPAPGRYTNRMSMLAADEQNGVALRGLNLQSQLTMSGRPTVMRATAFEEYGIEGAKIALVAGPMEQVKRTLKRVMEAEGVPHSKLGGAFALDAAELRESYLFAGVSERNVEQWIDLAKRAGIRYIHYSGWVQSLGHYELRKTVFPNGLAGMKGTVAKIHAAGLKAGMHTLTGCIATRDSWVTPVPDPRLAADRVYTLAADMDAASDTVLTVERPGKHDTIWSYSGSGNVLRIGSELIHYAAISSEEPYGFLKCTRGAFKSTPSAHAKSAKVDHLRQRYLAFYPDEKTDLVDEVADCIARVYNECEMDQIYMDGAEGMGGWHRIAVMRNAIFARLKRPAVVEASCHGHLNWPFHSRVGAWDHPKWGLKQWTDMHCKSIENYRKSALLQSQLGWWAIFGPTPYCRAETPDELEYFCCKALAFDAPISIQGVGVGRRPANARQEEYFTTVGRYERLRRAGYFTEEVKERLRTPRQDFRLVRAASREWQFEPTDYVSQRVRGNGETTSSWTVTNRYDAQRPGLRVEALYAALPYDAPGSLLITDFSGPDLISVRRAAPGVSQATDVTTEHARAGDRALCLKVKNAQAPREASWAQTGIRFSPHLDLQACRAVGMWIHGDGKGEMLNVQLSNPREYTHAYAEHYIDIDFTGWRYIVLLLRERDAHRYHDYKWPYYSQHGIFRNRLIRSHVSGLNLYVNNVPKGDQVEIRVGPIRALPTRKVQLRNPTVTIAGTPVVLEGRFWSGIYIECDPSGACRHFDERGYLLRRFRVTALPTLASGTQTLGFRCEGEEGLAARADVTIVTHGAPFGGRNPAERIRLECFERDYATPWIVTSLNGPDSQWTFDCPGKGGADRLLVEMTVEQVGATGAAYAAGNALTIEDFGDLAKFQPSDKNRYTKYVYDGKHRSMATKPGVTHKLEREVKVRKTGADCARYTASSTRTDRGGWSSAGRRFQPLLDLSEYKGVGCWLHGDGGGESFKVQLRDDKGKWHDMVTRVDFTGWRYIEFTLVGAKLDLSRIEYLIIYYNGIPAGRTVSCCVDDIRVVKQVTGLRNPTLTVGDLRIRFPVTLASGDRIVLREDGSCHHYAGGGKVAERVSLGSSIPALGSGSCAARLAFAEGSPEDLRVRVSLGRVLR